MMISSAPVIVQKDEAALAREARQKLLEMVQPQAPLVLHANEQPDQVIELPASAVSLLLNILDVIACGQQVVIVPQHAELTTAEAAELLNVSRPFVIQLLKEGHIPYRKVGTHRRVRVEDVLRYKQETDYKRAAVLDQLAAEAQEEGMGYEVP
jgi:excisionase family DNA binding protein